VAKEPSDTNKHFAGEVCPHNTQAAHTMKPCCRMLTQKIKPHGPILVFVNCMTHARTHTPTLPPTHTHTHPHTPTHTHNFLHHLCLNGERTGCVKDKPRKTSNPVAFACMARQHRTPKQSRNIRTCSSTTSHPLAPATTIPPTRT